MKKAGRHGEKRTGKTDPHWGEGIKRVRGAAAASSSKCPSAAPPLHAAPHILAVKGAPRSLEWAMKNENTSMTQLFMACSKDPTSLRNIQRSSCRVVFGAVLLASDRLVPILNSTPMLAAVPAFTLSRARAPPISKWPEIKFIVNSVEASW